MRGVAALMVVIDHFLEQFISRHVLGTDILPFAWSFGNAGVYIFFAISGFTITLSTRAKFARPGAALWFMERRVIRIVPLYYLMTLLFIPALYLAKHSLPSLSDLANSFLFLPYLNHLGLFQPVYALGWSLDFEMFFYIVFAVAMLFSFRRSFWGLIAFFLALIAAGAVYGLSPYRSDLVTRHLIFFTSPVIFYFVMGMGIAALYTHPAVVRRTARLSLTASSLAAVCLSVAAVVLPALFAAPVILAARSSDILPPLLALPMVLAVMILAVNAGSDGHASIIRVISRNVGKASYSLYLTHSFVIGGLSLLFSKIPVPAPYGLPLCFAIVLVVSCAVAAACYRYIEQPLLAAFGYLRGGRLAPK